MVYKNFNPRPPQRGRRITGWGARGYIIFQSTSPAKGTTVLPYRCKALGSISIHVPRKGDDLIKNTALIIYSISIHVPRKGDDRKNQHCRAVPLISIHVPRKGDDVKNSSLRGPVKISIHVPRKGDDGCRNGQGKAYEDFNPRPPQRGRPCAREVTGGAKIFQSTSPAKGTTWISPLMRRVDLISIHVPRKGDDLLPFVTLIISFVFQSTSPAKGTT